MLDYSVLSNIGQTLFVIGGYSGIVALVILGAYLLLRFAARPISSIIFYYALPQEKRAISRLLSPGTGTAVLKGVKNQQQLAGLMKSIAVSNGWENEDVENLPAWLLTGHLILDANPNLPSEYSKRSNNYRETDMN